MKLILLLAAVVAVSADPQFGFGAPAQLANAAVGAAAGAAAKAAETAASVLQSFGDYQKIYNKVYATAELAQQAQELFTKNFVGLDEHNKAFAEGKVPFKMGVNEFFDGDLLSILTGLCGTVVPDNVVDEETVATTRRKRETPPKASSFPKGPESVDYTAQMQPIVHQGSCGGCWSFAAIAQLEALYSKKSSNYKISQQYLLDCTEDTKGCKGGWPKKALDFVLNHGAALNETYPYKNEKETCQTPSADNTLPKIAAKSRQYDLKGNENHLKNILAAEGPIVVVMNAPESLMKYAEGVYYDASCESNCKKVNHATLLLGYGTDSATGKDYWLLRNSWGTTWGESGYLKLLRDGSNHCGIACYAMYLKD
jgi:cathepsin L